MEQSIYMYKKSQQNIHCTAAKYEKKIVTNI